MPHVRLDVYADISCPFCRLGRHQLDKAITALDTQLRVQTRHRPHQLDPAEPERPVPLKEMMARKYGANATAMFDQMRSMGEQVGLVFDFDRALAVNTFTAHRLLLWAGQDYGSGIQHALSGALYDAYFRDGGDIADHAQLIELAANTGMDAGRVGAFLRSGEGVTQTHAEIADTRARGISAVPTLEFTDGSRITGPRDPSFLLQTLRDHLQDRSDGGST